MDVESSSEVVVITTTPTLIDGVTTTAEICWYEPPEGTERRFWMVTVFGSTIAFFSIIENLVLFYIFVTRKHHHNNYNMYMMLIAIFDVFISIAYIALMSVNILSDYLISRTIIAIWFFYMIPMITFSHIALISSSFLIVCATFERFCLATSSGRLLRWAQKNRKLIAIFAILLGVFSKGPMYFEYEVIQPHECYGLFMENQIQLSEFATNIWYNTVFRIWYRNIVTIFMPFFILVLLNVIIVMSLSRQTNLTVCQLASNVIVEQAKRKMYLEMIREKVDPDNRRATARAATRTMVAVVCCYLISNIISVILTGVELYDSKILTDQKYSYWAGLAIDLSSLLTTMACFFRLPIILICQPAFRIEFFQIVNQWFICRIFSKRNRKIPNENGECLLPNRPQSTGGTSILSMESGKDHVVIKKMPVTNGSVKPSKVDEDQKEHDQRKSVWSNGYETLL
ncbi:hypothetical protein WR25_10076 [Diploscapter pachys]|uniref:G-protein coupled receptors family 1 profile domain-containing protein n=1 Tax=Diploscapter pachys TaxID=2018661 RepID=A0A2A2JAP4_9BILA|nr:hypothetical protein WR25_10076 [Diploscapter pachys]